MIKTKFTVCSTIVVLLMIVAISIVLTIFFHKGSPGVSDRAPENKTVENTKAIKTTKTIQTSQTLKIGTKTFELLLAKTSEEVTRGLGGRASLPADQAMLFIFDQPLPYGFWMKDMRFSIDIIWLDANGRVVHIEKNLSPATYPQVFYPPSPALYVLEINAGQSDFAGLRVGDLVRVPY